MWDKSVTRSNKNSPSSVDPDLSTKFDGKVLLLFINSNESYYYKGFSDLDNDKFLWLYFHEDHEIRFDSVYFLKFDPNQIRIKDYGDAFGTRFVREGKIGRKNLQIAEKGDGDIVDDPSPKEFKTMLTEYNKAGAGIVVTIDDFIELLNVKELNSAVREFIKNRRGYARIVILVSELTEQLLNSEVLQPFLSDKIRGIASRNECIRDVLYDEDIDNCIFLDRITREDAKNIVLNHMSFDKEHFDSGVDFDCLVDYLTIVTDENVPVDDSFGLTNKIKSRKKCFDYIESAKGWNKLVNNCYRISRDSLLLTDLSENVLNHKGRFTNRLIKDDVEQYRRAILDNYLLGKEPCIYFPLVWLCNELNTSVMVNDLDTKSIIVASLRIFSYFTYFTGSISLANKKYIACDLFKGLKECIEQSGDIYRNLQALNNGVSEILETVTKKMEEELRKSLSKWNNTAIGIYKNPGRKPTNEIDIYDI